MSIEQQQNKKWKFSGLLEVWGVDRLGQDRRFAWSMKSKTTYTEIDLARFESRHVMYRLRVGGL